MARLVRDAERLPAFAEPRKLQPQSSDGSSEGQRQHKLRRLGRLLRPLWIVPAVLGCILIAFELARHGSRVSAPPPVRPGTPTTFVGEPLCASCHPREDALWRGSHHQLAMQPADASTILGDFRDVSFEYA